MHDFIFTVNAFSSFEIDDPAYHLPNKTLILPTELLNWMLSNDKKHDSPFVVIDDMDENIGVPLSVNIVVSNFETIRQIIPSINYSLAKCGELKIIVNLQKKGTATNYQFLPKSYNCCFRYNMLLSKIGTNNLLSGVVKCNKDVKEWQDFKKLMIVKIIRENLQVERELHVRTIGLIF